MDKLVAIQAFVKVAELGSFTAVAEVDQRSKSTISQLVRDLELSLGVRLLHRTTRSLQLTPEGQVYLKHCRQVIDCLEQADASVLHSTAQLSGKLRLNIPMSLGIVCLSSVLADFSRQYPQIELDVQLGDQPQDLVKEGFDVGLRVSTGQVDSIYVGRPLASFHYRVCTSAQYLTTHPPIESVQI